MPLSPGEVLAAWVFEGPNAGPGGCMTTMGLSHISTEAPSELASELYGAFATTMLPGLSNDLILVECRVRIGTSEGEIVSSAFQSAAGTESGSSLPPNCCLPVTKFTASGGRANKGRMFLPGMTESHVDEAGNIDSGIIVGFNDSLEDFKAALEATDSTLVILHQATEDPPTEIVSLVCGAKIFTRGTRLRS